MDFGWRSLALLYLIFSVSLLLIAMYDIKGNHLTTLVSQLQASDRLLSTVENLTNERIVLEKVANAETATIKSITIPKTTNKAWLSDMHFVGCRYSKCTFTNSERVQDILATDLVILLFNSRLVSQLGFILLERGKTVMILGHEPQASRWKPELNVFNGSLSHWRHSSIQFPYFTFAALPHVLDIKGRNFAKGKTRGAFAYVSNCHSANYNRLELMNALSAYIDVDVFGHCTKRMPCSRLNFDCENRRHSQYRFFLAFENSLCEDYITEKFWKRLNSSAIFIPIAMGGLSVDDYHKVAPPHSFLHVNNFTSVRHLGKYLRHLMEDDAAYNRYHQWRSQYTVIKSLHKASCDLCEVAHNPQLLRKYERVKLADEFNNERNCRKFNSTA